MISVIIVTGKVFHCFCLYDPSDNTTEIRYFGTVRLLRPKQNKVLYVNMEYMDLLPPTAPSLVFARETCTPYNAMSEYCSYRNQGCFDLQHVEGGSSKVEWYLGKTNTTGNYIWSEG